MNNHFTVLMHGYNSIQWIEKCLNSVLIQTYHNYDIICVDACTTDGTHEYLKNKLPNVIRNTTQKYQLENISLGVSIAKEKSIIVTLDFDDWFHDKDVLKRLNEYYNDNIWMTYGTYEEFPYRSVSHIYHQYPDNIVETNTFRQYKWLASHLRTFRRELFLNISENDKKINKEYLRYAGDLAFMFPMLEMAGNHSKYISDIMYVYNRTNPLSEDKIASKEQERNANYIKSKQPYSRLQRLY